MVVIRCLENHATRELLTNRARLEELELEARSRVWPTWAAYAADLWDHLVPVN